MITQLYTFSVGSYVVAEEWNANFRVLEKTNVVHEEAIADANSVIAFPTSDLSSVFAAVNGRPNSQYVSGNTITVSPEWEYYTVYNGTTLSINIPSTGLNAEARVLLQVTEDTALQPFTVNYSGGTVNLNDYGIAEYKAGFYYIMIYESNGAAQVKLIWTGV